MCVVIQIGFDKARSWFATLFWGIKEDVVIALKCSKMEYNRRMAFRLQNLQIWHDSKTEKDLGEKHTKSRTMESMSFQLQYDSRIDLWGCSLVQDCKKRVLQNYPLDPGYLYP